MTSNTPPPTPFESMAGICKFIAVERISPAFYSKHTHPVEFASAFLRLLASSYPSLEKALRAALPLSLAEGAIPIRDALSELALAEDKVVWLDSQMTEVLRTLVPVVRDPDLPSWLLESAWAIEGAFYDRAA